MNDLLIMKTLSIRQGNMLLEWHMLSNLKVQKKILMQYLMNNFWNFLERTPFVNFVYLLDMIQSYTKVVAIKKMEELKNTNIK